LASSSLDASVIDGEDSPSAAGRGWIYPSCNCGGAKGHGRDSARHLVGARSRTFRPDQGFVLENLQTPQPWHNVSRPCTKRVNAPHAIARPSQRPHESVTVLARDWPDISPARAAHRALTPDYRASRRFHRFSCRTSISMRRRAAGGTGVGEEMLRITGSFFIADNARPRVGRQTLVAAILRVTPARRRRGQMPGGGAFLALAAWPA